MKKVGKNTIIEIIKKSAIFFIDRNSSNITNNNIIIFSWNNSYKMASTNYNNNCNSRMYAIL